MKNKFIFSPQIALGTFLTKWHLFNHSLASVCRTLIVLNAFLWIGILQMAKEALKATSQRGNSGLEAEFENYGTNSKTSILPTPI